MLATNMELWTELTSKLEVPEPAGRIMSIFFYAAIAILGLARWVSNVSRLPSI